MLLIFSFSNHVWTHCESFRIIKIQLDYTAVHAPVTGVDSSQSRLFVKALSSLPQLPNIKNKKNYCYFKIHFQNCFFNNINNNNNNNYFYYY